MGVETELSVSLPSTERPGQDIETRSRCEPLAPIVGVSARCSGSSVGRTPRPAQVGQAPCELLKLKVRGAISGRLIPQEAPVGCSENSISSPPIIDIGTMRAPSFSVVPGEPFTGCRNYTS